MCIYIYSNCASSNTNVYKEIMFIEELGLTNQYPNTKVTF